MCLCSVCATVAVCVAVCALLLQCVQGAVRADHIDGHLVSLTLLLQFVCCRVFAWFVLLLQCVLSCI